MMPKTMSDSVASKILSSGGMVAGHNLPRLMWRAGVMIHIADGQSLTTFVYGVIKRTLKSLKPGCRPDQMWTAAYNQVTYEN